MRTLIILAVALVAAGCTRVSLDHHLNNAYRAYNEGDCARVALELSQAERKSRSRNYLQPEISLLRGQCLERDMLYVDAGGEPAQHEKQWKREQPPEFEFHGVSRSPADRGRGPGATGCASRRARHAPSPRGDGRSRDADGKAW